MVIDYQLLTKEFRRWLIQEEINQKIKNNKNKRLYYNNGSNPKMYFKYCG